MASSIGDSAARPGAISMAVLGDSTSHSYQDRLSFPDGSPERGGLYRPRTFQWPEVLTRLRGQEIDLGTWGRWGRSALVAQALQWIGFDGGRAPAKEDYFFNFANTGATCYDLLEGRRHQVKPLVAAMNQDPERWSRGVVVIRIGLNNWSGLTDLQAQDPAAAELKTVTAYCTEQIGRAIALIHASHPKTRILLVGIANTADDPDKLHQWQTAAATVNIRSALDAFNGAIRDLTKGDPRLAFFDDLAFFYERWGARDALGKPAYGTVAIGPDLRITNTAGDEPHNISLADGHAGVAFNALWVQSLVARLDEAFGLKLTPVSDAELQRFLTPLLPTPREPGS
ncbi:SGNH/GDSL hydrolase family protein [Variovorax saccharolyticus]|uniref:SGNH/GDSL hydrolase family protein n=1 Tax=Variovorax saccharolyticus TaxID=3053516 RepID=UPI0025770AA3|nr:SGNH/GDSL hydrolase family protein [Variovorax sp. J22R187]MDM0020814.1 SGNH/GDSL hydrolase family protein [Variovorax sp. J22R187]